VASAQPRPGALSAAVAELPGSRVRLDVTVPAAELERRVESEARALGRRMKLPGFRRGKVPAALVVQRAGRPALVESAVRGALSEWYAQAIAASGIVPVGDPRITLGETPPQGEPFTLQVEVGVLPRASLGRYKGLEVGRREPEAPEEEIDAEVEALRDRLARLEDVERPAAPGDFVVIDFTATRDGAALAGGEVRDRLVELGAGRLLPGLEEGLLGASAGEQRAIDVHYPPDHPESELAGATVPFSVTVKQVKAKQLPALDDDFAADAGFDSLAQLREEVASHLTEADRERVEREFREAALDEAVAQADVDVPESLARARAQEMWERTLRSLERQGVSREAYLQVAGRSEEDVLAELAPTAAQALRREAVLTAVVEAEGIAPDDAELLRALGGERGGDGAQGNGQGEEEGAPEGESAGEAAELLERLRRAGRLEEAREELAARRAIDLIADAAKPIPLERARARERLWTPAKELAKAGSPGGPGGAPASARSGRAAAEEGRPGGLWTPGS
jgi:trigger factor